MEKIDWINRLCKWRSVFVGWQLGTRPKGDPEADAIRDHRELTMMLRAEVSALTELMVSRGLFTTEEFEKALQEECWRLCTDYQRRFPGFRAVDDGMHIDVAIARDTMAGWKP